MKWSMQTPDVLVISCSVMSDSLQLYGLYRACQVPLSVGFCKQGYWSWLPCAPPGDLPDAGIEHVSYVFCIGRQVLYHLHVHHPGVITTVPLKRELTVLYLVSSAKQGDCASSSAKLKGTQGLINVKSLKQCLDSK